MNVGWGTPRSHGVRDDLRDAVLGLRSYSQRFMAAIEQAAPPVSPTPPPRRVSNDSLFVLGLIAVCVRLERLYEPLPAAPRSEAPEAPPARPGGFLR